MNCPKRALTAALRRTRISAKPRRPDIILKLEAGEITSYVIMEVKDLPISVTWQTVRTSYSVISRILNK